MAVSSPCFLALEWQAAQVRASVWTWFLWGNLRPKIGMLISSIPEWQARQALVLTWGLNDVPSGTEADPAALRAAPIEPKAARRSSWA